MGKSFWKIKCPLVLIIKLFRNQIYLQTPCLKWGSENNQSAMTDPVVIGSTGVGKSTISNYLLGCQKKTGCLFRTCIGRNSCTKSPAAGTGKILPNA